MYIIIFNVGLGQCIFFSPKNNKEYCLMVDCGNTQEFHPIDFLIDKKLLPYDSIARKYQLRDLTLTNYDQDHFSDLPYIKNKTNLLSVCFPPNLTGTEIKSLKLNITDAINEVAYIRDNWTSPVTDYNPPFDKKTFYLKKSDFDTEVGTNELSQLVFITYKNVRICIPGDLTSIAWDKLLKNEEIINYLKGTTIFITSHHGRKDGYNEKIFNYCKPESIIISDTDINYDTQDGMSATYAKHVTYPGIWFNNNEIRQVLTTRSDGNILIEIEDDGMTKYSSLYIN